MFPLSSSSVIEPTKCLHSYSPEVDDYEEAAGDCILMTVMREMLELQRKQSETIARQAQLIEQQSRKISEQSMEIKRLFQEIDVFRKNSVEGSDSHQELDNLPCRQELSGATDSRFKILQQRISSMSEKIHVILSQNTINRANRQLGILISKSCKPRSEEVILLIRSGSDLHYCDSTKMKRPIMHALVSLSLLEPLRVALDREDMIDLRVTDVEGNTLLHTVLQCDSTSEQAETMLTMVRDRLQNSRARTLVDWNQRNASGDDVVNAAARHGRLSLFWKCMASISYWDKKIVGEIELDMRPKSDDWEMLGERNQAFFYGRVVPSDINAIATQELLRLHRKKGGKPALLDIDRCVRARADVTARTNDLYKRRLIHNFMWNGYSDAVKLCLKSPCSIDFTAADTCGYTPLHCIALKKDRIASYLPLVFDRVLGKDHGPGSAVPDKIDWGQKEKFCGDCISDAAYNGNLFDFWRLVKIRGLPYYMNYPGKIPITEKVKAEDYNRLSEEDKQRFELKEGFMI